MKKISVILAFVMVLSLFASLGFAVNVTAADKDAPRLVYEPSTKTYKPGSTAVLKTVASGDDLHFSWLLMDGMTDQTFDLTKAAGKAAFEALDKKGKMKIRSIKEYSSGGNTTSELTIENLIDTNYGFIAVCTVSNSAAFKATDPAYIYTAEFAPEAPEIEMISELDVRIGRLLKFACNVYPANDDYESIEYRWYETPDGKKENGVQIPDEDYSVLVVDTGLSGTYCYYCTIYINTKEGSVYYESPVSVIKIHEPLINVTYSENDLMLDVGKSASIKANAVIEPESDREGCTLSYQWYKGGNNLPGTFTQIKGANSDTLVVVGAETAGKTNYFCEIRYTSAEGCEFSNVSNDMPIVSVHSTGEKNAEIIVMPKSVKTKENTVAVFSVKAVNAKSYEWYMEKPGKTTDKPVKLENGKNGVISGADGDTLKINALPEYNGYLFHCSVSGSNGKSVLSSAAALEVIPDVKLPAAPKITEQPKSVTANAGDKVELSIQGTNTDGGILVYRWYASDTDNYPDIHAIDGADGREYEPDTKTVGVKYYCCAVWNVLGEYEEGPVYSDFARVEITEAGSVPEETTETEETVTEQTETAAAPATDTDTKPVQTENETSENTKRPDPVSNEDPNRTILTVLLIIICVLVAALIAIGITVLVKSGRKK